MPSQNERRPSPEELLRRIQAQQQEQTGQLKIFLGYASRVGKSYRMFDEARRRKMRGEDVVVASVQSKLTPDLESHLNALEIIPTIRSVSGQKLYDTLNVAAVLRRRPQVCFVDELAYDNPPGSRHARRWQDVQELLENGIPVVTAVNLQHIEEQQDSIARITGKRAAQSVPKSFVRTADEIVLVDIPPEELQKRNAMAGVDTRPLSELRELALLLTAEIVEGQLYSYLRSHGLEMSLGSQERILVCLTPRSNARKMLERGRRNADRFHCDLLALYVRQKNLSPEDQAAIERHLVLAEKLGAEVHFLETGDPVAAIVEFARARGVTQLFVGHSTPRGWQGFLSRNALDRLIRDAQGIDIRIFPQPTQS
jgi:two-component system, OmpR family, sensor histidine kinase KdpD